MKSLKLVLFGVSLAMAGCASNGDDGAVTREQLLAMKPAIDSVPSSGLGPQELAPGDCGLFLWSQTDVSKFIFFSQALSGVATFAQGEIPIIMSQTTAGGDIFGQFNTRMGFQAEDGRQLAVSIEAGELLDGGQRIERGLLTMTDRQGWETKLPVLGVRACQQE